MSAKPDPSSDAVQGCTSGSALPTVVARGRTPEATAAPDLNLEVLTAEALEAEIATLAASIAVATWRLLMLIAELDRREKWGEWGLQSCAHWLNWKCGIDLGAAREKVRVAKALQELPKVSATFATGAISYSKVRAITRVADPESQDYLLMIARHGTASHMERLIRGYRRVKRIEESAKAQGTEAARELQWHYDEDGSLLISARLPAERGALVLKALEAASEDLRRDTPQTGLIAAAGATAPNPFDHAESPAAARRADALCHLAEQFLANGATASHQAERYQVVVHINRDGLTENAADADCHIDQGPPLAPETARRIACDASIVEIDEDADGSPLDIGRRSRSIPSSIRRALQQRDRGCRFPGCLNHRYVDAHHIHHWADGGATSIRNLVLLCRFHHGLLHEGGFRLEQRDDGKLLFFRPDGRLVPELGQPVPMPCDIGMIVRESGTHVSAETCVPDWDGVPMDLHMAVAGLIQAAEHGIARPTG